MAQIKQSKMNVADRGGFDKKHAHGSRCRYQAVALVACRRPVRTSSLIQRPVHICRLLRQMLDKISRSDTCSFLDTHTHTPSHTHTHRHTDTHTQTHRHTHTHPHTRPHTRPHTYTHAHTPSHTPSHSFFFHLFQTCALSSDRPKLFIPSLMPFRHVSVRHCLSSSIYDPLLQKI